jgi:SAM-dependent methyltransferase
MALTTSPRFRRHIFDVSFAGDAHGGAPVAFDPDNVRAKDRPKATPAKGGDHHPLRFPLLRSSRGCILGVMVGAGVNRCADRSWTAIPALVVALAALPATGWSGEAESIAEVLALRAGQTVADIGAGNGEWSVELGRRVGERGHVYATEIEDAKLEEIRRSAEDAGLANVEAVLGSEDSTGLPPACCDAILVRLVYHHLTEPKRVVADLERALRPGGRMAIIDFLPRDWLPNVPGVPDRGGHGVRPEEVIAEVEAAGFRLVERHDEWEGRSERFCVVFDASPSIGPGTVGPQP